MNLKIILCHAILSAGISAGVDASADPLPPGTNASVSFGFPQPQPDPKANPDLRHSVTVQLPTRLKIERIKDSAQIIFTDFKPVKLSVGSHLITGIICEESFYLLTGLRQPPGLEIEGFDLLHPDSSGNILSRKNVLRLPQPGKQYTIERQLTLFETDEPPQHMWAPQSGKHYKVLWAKNFKEEVQ